MVVVELVVAVLLLVEVDVDEVVAVLTVLLVATQKKDD